MDLNSNRIAMLNVRGTAAGLIACAGEFRRVIAETLGV